MKRIHSLVCVLAVFGALTWRDATASEFNMCLMVYQMADNNLESFIRKDNLELTQSAAVKQKELATWVYFDGRDGSDQTAPLVNVYESDGSKPLRKYSGSQYLTYSHSLSKMIIDTRLPGEQNSDDPNTVYDFVTRALEDCVSKGAAEYMMIFSSHGTGFAGFGDDENDNRRHRHRHLLQSNQNIVNALQVALANVEGAPTQLDVLGFDACLMSSYVAMKEYASVTNYFLASEATEPGHGWKYDALSGDSVLDMAKNFHENFLSSRQGYSKHQAPKTLALVDMTDFDAFYQAMESLAEEMETMLKQLGSTKDSSFYTNLQRARSSAVAFDSFLDDSGSANPSAVDIGSFLKNFQTLCRPLSSSNLNPLLTTATSAYDNMFIKRGVGPGTPKATGMHIMWPLRTVYERNERKFDYYLLENPNVVRNAPNWFSFVNTYLKTTHRSSSQQADPMSSTCSALVSDDGVEAGTVVIAENDFSTLVVESSDSSGSELMINPAVVDDGMEVQLTVQLTADVDQIVVEVGIDSTALVARRRRSLMEEDSILLKPPSQTSSRSMDTQRPKRVNRDLRDSGGDYFLLFLGTVVGQYNQTNYGAIWDRKFFFLGDTPGDAMPVYVYDDGDGARSVPVMYFPSTRRITRNDIPIGTTLEDAVAELGGRFGSLRFGYDSQTSQVSTGFTLFTNDQGSSNSTITETPPSAGGQIVPILYVDGRVDGYDYEMFLGGFDRTILRWSEEHTIYIQMVSATNYLNAIPYVNTLIVNVAAFDFDANEGEGTVDASTFRIQQSSASFLGLSIAAALVSSVLATVLTYW